MTESTSLLEFPCFFPLKIIGVNTPNFKDDIYTIIRDFYPTDPLPEMVDTLSSNAQYISITATVYALNQTSLDALYQVLTKHPDIRMVL